MDSDILRNTLIFEKLKFEFHDSPAYLWSDFIIVKDMGIIFNNKTDEYKIIDEKKWLLAKLKYGV